MFKLIRFIRERIIINKNFSIFVLMSLFLVFVIILKEVDFSGWGETKILDFIIVIILTNGIVFICYKLFSLIFGFSSDKSFILISLFFNIILCILRVYILLLGYVNAFSLLILFLILTVIRNLFSFILSIYLLRLFKKYS